MIWFTGDINYCDGYFDSGIGVGSLIAKGHRPLMYLPHKKEDVWIGNFEGVCSDKSELRGIAAGQFIIEPDLLRDQWHPDIYAVANNHVMQHGQGAYKALLENIKTLGSRYVGSDEQKSVSFEHRGKKIAITAMSQRPENFDFGTLYWANPEYAAIQAEYEEHVKGSDFKVLYVHWGNEFMNYPYMDQRRFAHWIIDLGYDLIIGMHPHVLQGFEIYKGKHIFYSLGNTVFNMAWYKTRYGALVHVDLSQRIPQVGYSYVEIDKMFSPHIVEAEKVPADCRFDYLNGLIDHNVENEKYYSALSREMKRYRRANYQKIIKDLIRLKPSVINSMLGGFLKRHI